MAGAQPEPTTTGGLTTTEIYHASLRSGADWRERDRPPRWAGPRSGLAGRYSTAYTVSSWTDPGVMTGLPSGTLT
jgi:hypothetical protein